jgi:hypothetical protein
MKGMLTYIPLLLTALSIFFGATQYARTQQQEFRKRYWEAQFTLYTDAAASAAAIATARNLEDVDKERKRFWQLYWGPLSAIEHPEVESAMARYGAVLAECEGGKKESCPSPGPGATRTPLRDASINLAHCIRASLATTWHPVDIGDVTTRCQEQRRSTPPPPWWRSWLGL